MGRLTSLLMLCLYGFFGMGLAAAQVQVLTSFSVLADLARNVGGNRAIVSSIVPAGNDVHEYAPTAKDALKIGTAKLIIMNGLGLDAWLFKLVNNANSQAKIIRLSDGIVPRLLTGQTEPDPHMWWDIGICKKYVLAIRDALSREDPQGKNIYAQNSAKYIQQLNALDAQTQKAFANIPEARRKIVTNHDAFAYFAARYNIKIVGTIVAGGSTNTEPSAKEIAALIQTIRHEKVRAIFTENTVNEKLARTIAAETGATIAPALYSDALGLPGSDAETFIKMFSHNVANILAAIQ